MFINPNNCDKSHNIIAYFIKDERRYWMINNPYETTGLKNYNILPIKHKIEEALIMDESSFKPLDESIKYANEHVVVLNDPSTFSDIPLFSQPLMLTESNRVAIDCRGFVSNNHGSLRILKEASYKNHLLGACLTHYWNNGEGATRLSRISKFPTKVFSNWVSNTVAKKLNIDEIAQIKTNVLVGYYFLCLFGDYPEFSEKEVLDTDTIYSMATKISGASGLNTNDVAGLISEIPTISNINDLCTALRLHGGNPRFKNINTPLLYSLLNKGMFGVTPETVIAGLEFPPLFYAMIYICANERGYNKSPIGNIVHLFKNNKDVSHFVTEINSILELN